MPTIVAWGCADGRETSGRVGNVETALGAGQPGRKRLGGRRLGQRGPRQPVPLQARPPTSRGPGGVTPVLPGGDAPGIRSASAAREQLLRPGRTAFRVLGGARPGGRRGGRVARRIL